MFSEITMRAAKLEFGPVQTLAHKEGDTWVLNDPPPDPALELAKCQRYQVFGDMHASPLTVADSDAYCLLPLPATLRAKPTLTGTPEVRDTNNSPLTGTVSVEGFDANGVTLRVSGASKLVYVYGTFGLDANL